MMKYGLAVLMLLLSLLPVNSNAGHNNEYVILLHGLARSEKSMAKMADFLADNGFKTLNVAYPSREKKIETLARAVVPGAVETCRKNGAVKIHFVTHSMGGILTRYYLKNNDLPELGRVVMLSPPNQGSEAVDKLRDNFLFKKLNGPAGQQLGTEAASLPNRLGDVDFELGVITGDRTINLILSLLIPGIDDGKVSVERAKVDGMTDFLIIHATHPFIMKNKNAMNQVLFFLNHGIFKKGAQPACKSKPA